MKLASLFQNGAVFQRNATITVWGNAAANALVSGNLNGSTVYARTSATGDFTLYFPPQSAGGPFRMEVCCQDEKIALEDILIGEVWLASGQSNMDYKLRSKWQPASHNQDEPLSKIQETEFISQIEGIKNFRYFSVKQTASSGRETECEGSWKPIDIDCSAVAAWFGLYLQRELDVPVGLIISSWGGTVAEAWMSQAALKCHSPRTRKMLEVTRFNQTKLENYDIENVEPFSKRVLKYLRPDEKNEGFEAGFHTRNFDDSSWQTMDIPNSWIRQGISGNGAVWIRNKFTIPASWKNKALTLCAGCIDKQDISYFNGTEIGRTGSGAALDTYNVLRRYPIPEALNDSDEVTVAVRAYSACFDGSFLGEWYLEEPVSGEKLDLRGAWKIAVELDLGTPSPKFNSELYGPDNPNTPSILFDSMVNPLIPYTIAGTLWYQGESNAKSPEQSAEYEELLKSLIEDWRYHWQFPEMPFFIVQLAGYGKNVPFRGNSPWAYLRESQRKLAANHPNTYIATAIDRGDEQDIHPQDKESVGCRLAMCALNKVYHCNNITPGGPELLRAVSAGPGCVRLDFANACGMHLIEDAEQSFYLSGDGEEFFPADSAVAEGSSILLSCRKLDSIKCVRYAWSDYPANTLYNSEGFPALSFSETVK